MVNEVTVSSAHDVSMGVDQFTTGLTTYLAELGLPSEQVLVPVAERQRVIGNLPQVITLIDDGRKPTSIYLSKFIAACGAARVGRNKRSALRRMQHTTTAKNTDREFSIPNPSQSVPLRHR